MCHSTEYDHLIPSDQERAAMAAAQAADPDPEPRRPRDVSGPFIEHTPTWANAFPLVEDAETFARTLVFGERGRIACQRPGFDPYWCIVHSDDFADGAGACESAR